MLDSNIEKPKKTRAQRILDDIESQLRSLIKEKKELWKDFLERQREFEQMKKLYEGNWKKAERLENQLILLWDYWYREVEILKLEKQVQAGVLPSERGEINKKISELNKHNETLEMGFKQREIDAKIVIEIKKRLGIWEGNKKEEE